LTEDNLILRNLIAAAAPLAAGVRFHFAKATM
jgi:hypothetical protein